MTPDHTPGPWAVHHNDGYVNVGPDHLNPVVTMVGGEYEPGSPDEANARLIAAAPDLLAALDDLLISIDCRERRELLESCDRARTAIARATEATA